VFVRSYYRIAVHSFIFRDGSAPLFSVSTTNQRFSLRACVIFCRTDQYSLLNLETRRGDPHDCPLSAKKCKSSSHPAGAFHGDAHKLLKNDGLEAIDFWQLNCIPPAEGASEGGTLGM